MLFNPPSASHRDREALQLTVRRRLYAELSILFSNVTSLKISVLFGTKDFYFSAETLKLINDILFPG